ncbi:MAG: dockerin type I repeat-containing protein [Clostridia bacterium]|nr:dockerin type I repeat-containing protein [Clostridia bacterium]
MKRLGMMLGIVLALAVSVNALTAVAQGSLTSVTDSVYASIQTGGVNDTLVYTAYEQDGDFVMGTLGENGELTRQDFSLSGWEALIEDERFDMTIRGDAADQCPYAHTHKDNTICPYFSVLYVDMTDTKTGAVLKDQYIDSDRTTILPDGSVHFCWGRYGYQTPATVKWDGESAYMAVENSDGLWGVYELDTAQMVIPFEYENMSAVYDTYVKVFNGTAWGRLDVSGTYQTAFLYDDEAAFSAREEIRQLTDTTWQVFTKDNEAVSVVFEGDWLDVSYASGSHLAMMRGRDGITTFYDLNGDVVASFDAAKTVKYMQGACYTVSKSNADGTLAGIALYRADGTVKPEDTVAKYDVNFDGVIDSTDVRLMLCHVSSTAPLTALRQAAADIDDNGEVTSADARAVLVKIAK